jgi:hypothetical protein
MFSVNPFAFVSQVVSPDLMQLFVWLMAFLVIVGVLFDIIHKGSARYFFENMRRTKKVAKKQLGSGEIISVAIKTSVVDVMTSKELCNTRGRRIAHLLGMYGFVIYLVSTILLIFNYPLPSMTVPAIIPQLWWLGGIAVCAGGYWFWFFIRADVSAEGRSPFRVMRADLFILSLVGSVTLGLIWAWMQVRGVPGALVVFALYIIATTILFGGVPWSKFAHMFFKPAAAFEKRLSKENGFADNLPTISRNDPEQQARHSMELLKDAPMDMGLGIKREAPRHY